MARTGGACGSCLLECTAQHKNEGDDTNKQDVVSVSRHTAGTVCVGAPLTACVMALLPNCAQARLVCVQPLCAAQCQLKGTGSLLGN